MEKKREPKNIVICCDGTANQYGKNNTNVVKIYELIDIGPHQPNFYDPGVGTSSEAITNIGRKIGNLASQAFGLDLSRNVEDAYLYLMNTYEDGDQIFLFGFSRGAHTVRRLADVLCRLGLLYKGSNNMAPYVLRMYDKDEDASVIKSFRRTYTRECPVHFLGVWDTVSALSKMVPRSKLDGIIDPQVQNAYHAVAIDEVRFQFPPNLFRKDKLTNNQIREEVWFAGVHSDVGGFYNESGLSDIALKWMMEKAHAKGLKIDLDFDNIRPNPLEKIHNSWSGIFWFMPWPMYGAALLIVIAIAQALFKSGGLPYRPFSDTISLLGGSIGVGLLFAIGIWRTRLDRKIPPGSKVHSSVKEKMEKSNYSPKNLKQALKNEYVTWVD